MVCIQHHCVKSVQIRSIFRFLFSCIWTEYGEIRRISPYSVRMRENTDQQILRIWTLFTQCVLLILIWNFDNVLVCLRIQPFLLSEADKKGAMKNFARFTGKYLCLSLCLLELQVFKLQHRCFPVKFAKLLRTPILKNIWKRLLLYWGVFVIDKTQINMLKKDLFCGIFVSKRKCFIDWTLQPNQSMMYHFIVKPKQKYISNQLLYAKTTPLYLSNLSLNFLT